jgi:DNA polymerase, archaea type
MGSNVLGHPPTGRATSREFVSSRRDEDEWLSGWDPTPGIVSVWAENGGRAFVWRRIAGTNALVKEEVRFRPWLLLDRLDNLRGLGAQLGPEESNATVTYRELDRCSTARPRCS